MTRIRLQAFPAQYTPIPFENLAYIYEKKRLLGKEEDELKEKAYNEGNALETEFSKIGALPVDDPEKKRILGEFRKELINAYEVHKNNPKALITNYRNIQKKFQGELATGKLGGIYNRYLGYTGSLKQQEEYADKYIKTGGKGGVSPQNSEQHINYELTKLNAEPIKQTPYGTWETYKTIPAHYNVNIAEKANKLAQIMRESPEVITQFTGLVNTGKGYFVDVKSKKTYLLPEAIEQGVIAGLSSDSEVQGFLNYENTVTGRVDGLQQLFAMKDEEAAQGKPDAYTLPQTRYNRSMTLRAQNEDGTPNEESSQLYKTVLADNVLNSKVYEAAKAAGYLYKVNQEELSKDYKEDYLTRDAINAARKKQEEAEKVDYTSFEEGPGVDTKKLIGIPNEFFDVIPEGANIGSKSPGEGVTKGGRSIMVMPMGGSGVALPTGTAKKDTYKNPKTLSPNQQAGFKLLLGTIEDVSPEFKTISDKYKAGKDLTQEELAKVYPVIKKINERANKLTMTNANITTITDPDELKAASAMFGMPTATGTTTVKELGGGVALNRKVFDVENNKEITYADLIKDNKLNPATAEEQISIVAKLDGPNAISAVTGNRRYAHGYQFGIGGKTYYMEGAKAYKDVRLQVAAKENEFLSDLLKANLMPFVKLKAEHPTGLVDLNYQFVQTDPNNPDAGYYKILGLDTKGKTTEASQKFATTLLDPNYNIFSSPVELNAALNTYISLLDLD